MQKHLVTSLELSRTLEKLGVKQESVFSWFEDRTNFPEIKHFIDLEGANVDAVEICSAFLSDELGEMLPDEIELENTKVGLSIEKRKEDWKLWYGWKSQTHKNLTEAMGKMLAFLVKNGMIDIDK